MPSNTRSGRGGLSGRRAQAARNDELILRAAREVFIESPDAPVSEVAHRAGVGISALYKRFGNKEGMITTLCVNGLRTYIDVARAASQVDDPAEAFDTFVTGIVDSDVHALTVHLAGMFTPPDEVGPLVAESEMLTTGILGAAKTAGSVRPDYHVNDLSMLFEQLAAIRLGDADRTHTLRRRYLAIHLDGLRPRPSTTVLPGVPPSDEELGARWVPEPSL
jgi:AcrR family transcriptional regulator